MSLTVSIRDLVSPEEWAIVYADLSGNPINLADKNETIRHIKSVAYDNRIPTKRMSNKLKNKINMTLDMFSKEGKEQYERKNARRVKHEKMLADKNKK